MSIERAKDRKGITKEVTDTKKDTDKQLKDAQKVVGDKRVLASTAKSLRLRGPSEGVKKIRKTVERAGDATDKKHKKMGKELKKKGIDRARRTEKELNKRSKEVGKDIQELKQATAKLTTQESKKHTAVAEKTAQQDKTFLSDTKTQQERQRKDAEKKSREQSRAVKAARINFRN